MSTELSGIERDRQNQIQAQAQLQAKYQSRLNELIAFACPLYGLDHHLLRLLLLPFLPHGKQIPLWLLIHSKPCQFWDHMEYALCHNGHHFIQRFEYLRYRGGRKWTKMPYSTDWRGPRLIIDEHYWAQRPIWERIDRRSLYWDFTSRSLPLRVQLDHDRAVDDELKLELTRLVGLAIDSKRQLVPMPVDLPPKVNETIASLKKTNLDIDCGAAFRPMLSYIPTAHAVLCGRTYPVELDWNLLKFILQSGVRHYYLPLLQWFYEHGKTSDQIMRSTVLDRGTGLSANKIANKLSWQFRQYRKWGLLRKVPRTTITGGHKAIGRIDYRQYPGWKGRPIHLNWDLTEDGYRLAQLMFDPTWSVLS